MICFICQQEDWPASLIAFCQWSKKLKLKPEIFNPSEKLELPEIIKAGVTPKKTHEVDNLVPFIHSLCSDHSINRIVDVGSGLVSEKILLLSFLLLYLPSGTKKAQQP